MVSYIFLGCCIIFAASEGKPTNISDTACNLKCTIGLDYKPVCGSNFVTYQNDEELDCAKELCFPDLRKISDSKCTNETTATRVDYTLNLVKPESATAMDKPNKRVNTRRTRYRCENCACPQTLMPVCGSDNTSYQNLCALKCKGWCDTDLKLLHWGQCEV